MCDLRTFSRIERAVEQKMAAGQMFTCFDITLQLRSKGMRKAHREVRRDIRRVADELMWRFGYEKSPVRFREIDATALVYHPFGSDATVHRPATRAAKRVKMVIVQGGAARLISSLTKQLVSRSQRRH